MPGVPKRYNIRSLSYNLNALPLGAAFIGGPGHDFRKQRLQRDQSELDRATGVPELLGCICEKKR